MQKEKIIRETLISISSEEYFSSQLPTSSVKFDNQLKDSEWATVEQQETEEKIEYNLKQAIAHDYFHQWEYAQAYYYKVIKALPKIPLDIRGELLKATLLNQLAITYERLGNFIEAYYYFSKSYLLSRDDSVTSQANNGMRWCLLRMGNELLLAAKNDQAKVYYDQLQLDVFNPTVHYQLLKAHYAQERFEVALEQAQIIALLFPNEILGYCELARLYFKNATLAQLKGEEILYQQYKEAAKNACVIILRKIKKPELSLFKWAKAFLFSLQENYCMNLNDKPHEEDTLIEARFKPTPHVSDIPIHHTDGRINFYLLDNNQAKRKKLQKAQVRYENDEKENNSKKILFE